MDIPVLTLISVVTYLNWTSVCIIFDHKTERNGRKPVRLVSSFSKAAQENDKPAMICAYNKFMGGVDLADMMTESYNDGRKTLKVWKKVVFNRMHRMVINAYILYQQNTSVNPKLSRLVFTQKLIEDLAKDHMMQRNENQDNRQHKNKNGIRKLPGHREKDCDVCSDRNGYGVEGGVCKHEAIQLHKGLSKIGTFGVIYRIEEVTSFKIDVLSNTTFKDASDILNFIVLCKWETSRQFLKQPFDYDRKNPFRNSLLHYSRWLVGIFHTSTDVTSCPSDSGIEFDNLAFIQYNLSSEGEHHRNYTPWIDNNNCKRVSIETLMWSNDRKRKLTTVGYVYFNGSLYLQKDIFPNVKFGFNQRRLLISLLPEVDLVAAPLATDAHRETVSDFTLPYYYEKSGIIIKKPDPSYSTKLFDPLNPMVYICIGISLPVSTFFLFLFEKFNPFYRNVASRMKMRGLHHFSDSFFYMYGALFCQGGEHVAASSAGRTLLSCWWLFCIIMVATYSGNFVAFLTVTKETLPFKDVEGLVEQSTYKWGIAGATIFETILKNSELPERKKIWNGILKFNQSDPSVLNSDPAEQIRKVRGGKYAYIGDRTYLDMAIGESCDMSVISPADFHTLLIALPLPSNSPFLKVFSDEIVSIVEGGLIQIWLRKALPKLEKCEDTSVTVAKSISVLEFQFAFYIIGIGLIIAFLSLIYEHIKRKFYQCTVTRSRRRNGQRTTTYVKDINPITEFYSNINGVNETPIQLAIRRQIPYNLRSTENKRNKDINY
ncbi:GRIN [Mytilus coruscus]|uniref:GRIN n=1 Tax=Mytilus coruscus TaxID=42192 RepID=A0A6J8C024_MYTCO|nr:GRIN [Mytilus coruscus]